MLPKQRRFGVGKKHGMSEMGTLYLITEDGKELEVNLCTDSEALYKRLREAVHATSESALKLRHPDSKKALHISPRIPPNTPDCRYIISVYPPNGMLVDEVNMDLVTLENRLVP
ncbi:hypothetical protein GE061_008462 [Apolygus lucorum]|uniref:Uncharacterized protein n=1 Tax=Apolygus lucorum TaxID=248454 RepID=A0A8S9WP39_APOLU|nr:hypothetical protein GE061_008462 [Apolygus lucorum]